MSAAKRDRRKPVVPHTSSWANPAFTYYRDPDGAIRPKLTPAPDPRDAVAVPAYLIKVDRLGRGRDGGRYNPRGCTLSGDFKALAIAAVHLASQETAA